MRTRGSESFIVLPLLPIFLIGLFPMLLLSLLGPAGLIILGILVASAGLTDILDASGALTIRKVYADRVTGNCSHQHGTARMGDDGATSVLNRWCRAHEVENLYAVDGSPFPTGTGANPTLTIMANAWRVADKIIAERGAAA